MHSETNGRAQFYFRFVFRHLRADSITLRPHTISTYLS
jgi:hypothetical protein